jgi:hypothetical protein
MNSHDAISGREWKKASQSWWSCSWTVQGDGGFLPFGLVLLKDDAFGVVADRPGLDKTAQVKLLRPKHRHAGQARGGMAKCLCVAAGEAVMTATVGAKYEFLGGDLFLPKIYRRLPC